MTFFGVAQAHAAWSPLWTFQDCTTEKAELVKSSILQGIDKLEALNPIFTVLMEDHQKISLNITCQNVPTILNWIRGSHAVGSYLNVWPFRRIFMGVQENSEWDVTVQKGIYLHEFIHFLIANSDHDNANFLVRDQAGFYGIEKDVTYACSSTVFPDVYVVSSQGYIHGWTDSHIRTCLACLEQRLDRKSQSVYRAEDLVSVEQAEKACAALQPSFVVN